MRKRAEIEPVLSDRFNCHVDGVKAQVKMGINQKYFEHLDLMRHAEHN